MPNTTKEQVTALQKKTNKPEINQTEEKINSVSVTKSSKKRFLKFLLPTLILLIALAVIVWLILPTDPNNQSVYSENQQRVILNFGKPQTFKIAMKDGQRLEYWRYIYLDEVFVFQDGEFIARQHFNFDVDDNQGIYFQVEPNNFYQLQKIEQVNDFLGITPTIEAEIDSQILGPDYKFYSYGDIFNITTHEDIVTVIDSTAIKKELDTTSQTNNQTPSTNPFATEKKGKIFIGNSDQDQASFSYYLDDEVYRYIKQRDLFTNDDDPAIKIYGYCYTLDQGASFSEDPQDPYACADNESMLWTISIYQPNDYQNIDEIMKTGDQTLFENTKNIFVISHANGDFPQDLPIWPVILEDIKNDFSVPMAKEYLDTI